MSEQYFIGMDLHQKTSTFSVKKKDGAVIDTRTIATDPAAIRSYLAPYAGSKLVHEPVSQWYYYADFIESLGLHVTIANPMKTKAIASARIKTDALDAGVLADLLRADLVAEAYHAPKEVRAWKELVRARMALVRLQTQVKNRIHALVWKQGLRHASLFSRKGSAWLDAQALGPESAMALQAFRSTLAHLRTEIIPLEKKITDTVRSDESARLLVTIPGLSYLSALTIMAEVGDVTRFPSASKLMSYAGLVPSTYASGGKVRHGKITKCGSSWLRYVLIEAAHHQMFCTKKKGLAPYYARMKERKGSSSAAVATARKLAAVVWRVLTDKRAYVPQDEWDNRRAHHLVIAAH